MIQYRCECGKLLQVRDDLAGVSAACPACARITTVPGGAAPRLLPALHPELPPPAPRARWRAVLGALFLIAVVGGGAYLGWWRNTDEARARRELGDGLPRHNGIRVRSIDLRPVPAEEGGESGDFTGAVTDEDGREHPLVRVRVRHGRVEWRLGSPEDKLREWVAQYVEKDLESNVQSFDVAREPDGRWAGRVTTASGLVLELGENAVLDGLGNLQSGSTKLQLTADSVDRLWEQRVRKRYSHLKKVSVKKDSEGSWSGVATDAKGVRYDVSIRAQPEEPGKERHYSLQVLPRRDE